MGGLHEGHCSLIRTARKHAGRVVATIFVNPLQFNEQRDFVTYPRSEEKDCAVLQAAGTDMVFIPNEKTMYPDQRGKSRTPSAGVLGKTLCGAFRPGHFDGVVTVVARLFELLEPGFMVFGEKDYQQLLIIRQMVESQGYPVDIIASPTVREPDGLAMSSRNVHIVPEQRPQANSLYRTLLHAGETVKQGNTDYEKISFRACEHLRNMGFRPEYFEFRDKKYLARSITKTRPDIVLAAGWLEKVRLIDNIQINREIKRLPTGTSKSLDVIYNKA